MKLNSRIGLLISGFAFGIMFNSYFLSNSELQKPNSSTHSNQVSEQNSTQEISQDNLSCPSDVKMDKPSNFAKSHHKECTLADLKKDPKYLRTHAKQNEKKMQQLYGALMMARRDGDLEKQNEIFSEMENTNPLHKVSFNAKAIFLQDDGDWDGAHQVLKECTDVHPDSLFCHMRLSNIRTSTKEEKQYHSKKCLEIDKNNTFCLKELALSHHLNKNYEKAKEIYEKLLGMKGESENGYGYQESYVYFQYGRLLEEMNLYGEASDAFSTACEMKNQPACNLLKKRTERSS